MEPVRTVRHDAWRACAFQVLWFSIVYWTAHVVATAALGQTQVLLVPVMLLLVLPQMFIAQNLAGRVTVLILMAIAGLLVFQAGAVGVARVAGVERLRGFDLDGINAGVVLALAAIFLVWAFLLIRRVWCILGVPPSQPPGRVFRVVVSVWGVCCALLAALALVVILAQMHRGISVDDDGEMTAGGLRLKVSRLVVGEPGIQRLGALIVRPAGAPRPEPAVPLASEVDVELAEHRRLPLGSVVFWPPDGEPRLLAQGWDLERAADRPTLIRLVEAAGVVEAAGPGPAIP